MNVTSSSSSTYIPHAKQANIIETYPAHVLHGNTIKIITSGFFNGSNDIRYNGIQNYQSRRCSSDTSACRIIMAELHITGAKPLSIYSMSIHICMCERLHRSITVRTCGVCQYFYFYQVCDTFGYVCMTVHALLV